MRRENSSALKDDRAEQCLRSCGSEFQMWGPKAEYVDLLAFTRKFWSYHVAVSTFKTGRYDRRRSERSSRTIRPKWLMHQGNWKPLHTYMQYISIKTGTQKKKNRMLTIKGKTLKYYIRACAKTCSDKVGHLMKNQTVNYLRLSLPCGSVVFQERIPELKIITLTTMTRHGPFLMNRAAVWVQHGTQCHM